MTHEEQIIQVKLESMKRKRLTYLVPQVSDLTVLIAGTGLSLRKIAKGCDLHYTFLSRAFNGHTNLSYRAYKKLLNFLKENQLRDSIK